MMQCKLLSEAHPSCQLRAVVSDLRQSPLVSTQVDANGLCRRLEIWQEEIVPGSVEPKTVTPSARVTVNNFLWTGKEVGVES